ncbi:MAG: M23 family metallopeptidase [Nitrospirae bacterium]|nr:M23 family metallopeptidase [Nitrospirota bacterium]
MRLFFNITALIIAILFVSSAHSFEIIVSPIDVKQGDVFAIKAVGDGLAKPPQAVMKHREMRFSSCGIGCYIAIGAVGIQTEPGAQEIDIESSGIKKKAVVNVRKSIFPVTELTLPEEKVTLSHDDTERAKRERERMESIFQTVSERLWHGSFAPPLKNEHSTPFGAKRILNKKKTSIHYGLDIKGKSGEKVRASNKGRAALTDDLFYGGKTVILDHGDGIYTLYMHLSEVMVRHGNIVSKGDVVGLVGATGRATGPHLHFGVRIQDVSANPVSLFRLEL